LHNWRGGFGQCALDTIDALIAENKEALAGNMKELLAEQFNAFLDKVCLSPDSENFTYAYQWGEWDMETKERQVSARLYL